MLTLSLERGFREAGNRPSSLETDRFHPCPGTLIPHRAACTRASQVSGDEHRLPAIDRSVRHVQPLDQLRALGHCHHQFLALEQRPDPLGPPMLADGVAGLGQLVPTLVDAVAAGHVDYHQAGKQQFLEVVVVEALRHACPASF